MRLRRIIGDVLSGRIAPTKLVGLLRYDQRREGTLALGDAAPDVALVELGGGEVRLSKWIGARPLVLIFGSFT